MLACGAQIIRYAAIEKVQDDRRQRAEENSTHRFRTAAGSEPVREWLKELPEEERHVIGKDLLRAQWRWPIGMPLRRLYGRRVVGNPYGSANEADGASDAG